MKTVSRKDIKSFEKRCRMMLGSRYNNSVGYGLGIIETSFRNIKGKSVYGSLLLRIGNGIIEKVTPLGCSYNRELLRSKIEEVKKVMDENKTP